MAQSPRGEWRTLIYLGAMVVVLLVIATLVPMFVVLSDPDRPADDVLPLTAGPLSLLVIGAVIAGIAAAVNSANRNARAATRSSEQGLRVGIVWILGISLIVLIGVFGALAGGSANLPDGLVALASSLVGGLIGVLAPRTTSTQPGNDPGAGGGEPSQGDPGTGGGGR